MERQAQRFRTNLVVTNINGQPETDAFLVDVSSLGAKLESSVPYAPGCTVKIIVLVPGEPAEITIAGSVKWARPLLSPAKRFQMGLEFYQRLWHLDQLGRTGKI